MTETQLRRLQWAVRATLTLGVAASVTANILHARPNPISQAIAAWPPLALLITVELVSRIPIYRKSLGAVRVIATAAIAGIAAWVSYHHMAAVVARYGETGTVPYLLPLSVDGLIVIASVTLVELAGRRRDTATSPDPAEAPVTAPTRPQAVPAAGLTEPVPAVPAEAVTVAARAVPSPAAGGVLAAAPTPGLAYGTATDGAVVHHRGDPGDSEAEVDPDDPDDVQIDHNTDTDLDEGGAAHNPVPGDSADLAPDLVPLLAAARDARDELTREGHTVSRDALARRMRRNGHTIRNNRVSELLAALRQEAPSANSHRPTASV
jgi:hypothetical protein